MSALLGHFRLGDKSKALKLKDVDDTKVDVELSTDLIKYQSVYKLNAQDVERLYGGDLPFVGSGDFVIPLTIRPSERVIGLNYIYEEVTESGDDPVSVIKENLPFCSAGWIMETLDRTKTSIVIKSFVFESVEEQETTMEDLINTRALIDDEIVFIESVDAVSQTLTVRRGCDQSIPDVHIEGVPIFFFDLLFKKENIIYDFNQDAVYKAVLQTITEDGVTPQDRLPTLGFSTGQNYLSAFPCRAIKINDQYWPELIVPSEGEDVNITITWDWRDWRSYLAELTPLGFYDDRAIAVGDLEPALIVSLYDYATGASIEEIVVDDVNTKSVTFEKVLIPVAMLRMEMQNALDTPAKERIDYSFAVEVEGPPVP